MRTIDKDIAVIGGGIGGTVAAISAAKMGKNVILTEETDWIGGQLTSQAVPPDEHKWIEEFGCTATYREFRNRIREHYRNHYPLKDTGRDTAKLNPGNCWVSRITHEPRVALNVFYNMLAPYLSNGTIELMLRTRPLNVTVNDGEVNSVLVEDLGNGDKVEIRGKYFLDATECGDLIPLAKVGYVTGAESKSTTGEEHAINGPEIPLDMQPVTHVAAVDYVEGGNFTIEKPEQYDFWRSYRADFLNHKQLSWYGPDAETGQSKRFAMFPGEGISLWDYRRIIDKTLFQAGFYKGDISLLNWPHNDYWLGPVFDVSEKERALHLEGARQLTLSLVYWLQTEAPKPDGGKGYPGIRMRGDVVGTKDGLAKHPYIRESRRIKALTTVKEQHINANLRDGVRRWDDSVGVGAYRIDLHPTTVTHQFFYTPSYPFEIPLGSLIPVGVKNMIASCKNIGSTHITNGCFRVHPVEWNIGESAGYLAAFCSEHKVTPTEVHKDKHRLREFQKLLRNQGVELHWPEGIGVL